jgi:hypothetical protein
MSLEYEIDRVSMFVDIRAYGVLTTLDVEQMYAELLGSADYDPLMPVLTDMSNVHTLDISVEGVVSIFQIAEDNNLNRGTARSAVVVNDQGHALFAKMSAALADQSENLPQINVFSTREEALAWLGVEVKGTPSA